MKTTYINGKANILCDKRDYVDLIREYMGSDFAETIEENIVTDSEWLKVYYFDKILDICEGLNDLEINDLEAVDFKSTLIEVLNVLFDYDNNKEATI